jgi:hypothetical protein
MHGDGDGQEEVIATAEELRVATLYYAEKIPAAREALGEAWVAWFRKRAPKALKDAAARGEFCASFPLPYQPVGRVERDGLRALRSRVGAMLPGCVLEFVGTALEGEHYKYELEVSWMGKDSYEFKKAVPAAEGDAVAHAEESTPEKDAGVPLAEGSSEAGGAPAGDLREC